ncbi:hypothetical protein C8D88_108142 [Lentzea atacamensis]|uniref:Uncharacterized protein n=1 Tax=Lentzea atacamensis TaxID=531938 RepID=A0A316HVT2_9PSEU|nr:hypothetical protein C8D88_108142 [Lentzea atacamensis]
MLGLDQVRRYAWADEDINLAWTLAVITGCTPADVVGAYGGDPHQSPESLPLPKPTYRWTSSGPAR